jgi:hypothetical protein
LPFEKRVEGQNTKIFCKRFGKIRKWSRKSKKSDEKIRKNQKTT